MQTPASETVFAAAAPGLEGVLAAEARLLGRVRKVRGGVEISGPAGLHQEANLRLRIAERVWLRLAGGRWSGWRAASWALGAVDVGRVAPAGRPIALEVAARGRHILADAALRGDLSRLWTRAVHPVSGSDPPGIRLLLRVAGDRWDLSADSSGELLHRRGWRQEVSRAPMRETLAAGLLALAGYDPERPFLDPFCGSGTLAIEAALKARRMAPGRQRHFAFEGWSAFHAAAWERRRALAKAEERAASPAAIRASDRNAGALGTARRNARRAGVLESLGLSRGDAAELLPGAGQGPGLLLSNLPFGIRIGRREDLAELFRIVAGPVRAQFRGWRIGLFTADPARLIAAFGARPDSRSPLHNGGIACELLVWDTAAPTAVQRSPGEACPPSRKEPA